MTRTTLLATLVLSSCTEPALVPEPPPKPLDEWLEENLPSYCPFSFNELVMGEGTLELVESAGSAWSDPLFAQSCHEQGQRIYIEEHLEDPEDPQVTLTTHPAWLDLDLTATSTAQRYRVTLDVSRFDDPASLLPEEYRLQAQGLDLSFPACEGTFEVTSMTWEGEVTTAFEVTPISGEGTVFLQMDSGGYSGEAYFGAFPGTDEALVAFSATVRGNMASVYYIGLPDGFMEVGEEPS